MISVFAGCIGGRVVANSENHAGFDSPARFQTVCRDSKLVFSSLLGRSSGRSFFGIMERFLLAKKYPLMDCNPAGNLNSTMRILY